jgi:hypothetical protein
VEVGNVSVPVFEMVEIIGAVRVLLVSVCVAVVPVIVVSTSGIVRVRVVPVVTPDNWNCTRFVASTSSTKKVVASCNDLFVNVCVVAAPNKVMSESGTVIVRVVPVVMPDN